MHKKTLLVVLSLGLISVIPFSCKKTAEQNKQEEIIENPFPGFYNINFNTIFTKKDNHSPEDERIKKQLNEYYHSIWEARNLSGGILIARGNNILFEKYRGYANTEKQIPVTPTTPLHVASISKILTSLAVLKLVEADKLRLDEKLVSFFPSFPYPDITVKELLNHRSGLPNYSHVIGNIKTWDKSKNLNNQDVLDLFVNQKPPLQSKPDSHFSYSNTNFALLALLVEKIEEKPFPEVLDQMIFEPLGMKHSFVFQEKNVTDASLSYYAKGTPYPFDYLDYIYGDKNLYTTPQDLFRLSQAMYAPNFLRKDLLDLMFTPYSNEKDGIKNYGLGMRMMVFDNGKKITYHTGWWHGNNTIFIHLLDEKVTIIAIGNKFSKAVYSALKLVSLFGEYPLHMDKEPDSNDTDSIKTVVHRIISSHKAPVKTDSATLKNKK